MLTALGIVSQTSVATSCAVVAPEQVPPYTKLYGGTKWSYTGQWSGQDFDGYGFYADLDCEAIQQCSQFCTSLSGCTWWQMEGVKEFSDNYWVCLAMNGVHADLSTYQYDISPDIVYAYYA